MHDKIKKDMEQFRKAYDYYAWEKVTVKQCKSCICYKGIKDDRTPYHCLLWPLKPKECYGYYKKSGVK